MKPRLRRIACFRATNKNHCAQENIAAVRKGYTKLTDALFLDGRSEVLYTIDPNDAWMLVCKVLP